MLSSAAILSDYTVLIIYIVTKSYHSTPAKNFCNCSEAHEVMYIHVPQVVVENLRSLQSSLIHRSTTKMFAQLQTVGSLMTENI